MHELTPRSIERVFEFLSWEPSPQRRNALLAWLPSLSRNPLGVAGYSLVDGTLYAQIPGSDIEITYQIIETPRGISITGIA